MNFISLYLIEPIKHRQIKDKKHTPSSFYQYFECVGKNIIPISKQIRRAKQRASLFNTWAVKFERKMAERYLQIYIAASRQSFVQMIESHALNNSDRYKHERLKLTIHPPVYPDPKSTLSTIDIIEKKHKVYTKSRVQQFYRLRQN